MNPWTRQYDLIQLKYLAVLKDLHEMERILTQPVVQQHVETRERAERIIVVMKGKISTYRDQMAYAKRHRMNFLNVTLGWQLVATIQRS